MDISDNTVENRPADSAGEGGELKTAKHEMIELRINGRLRKFRKFIPFPGPVNDGTYRCIRCGQIDEIAIHDHDLCVQICTGTAS